VNWGNAGWVVVSKSETEIMLALNTLAVTCESADVNDQLEAFKAALPETCVAVLGTAGVTLPSQAEVVTYTALTDLTLTYEGQAAGWYLSDGYVDSTGGVMDNDAGETGTVKGLRPFVTVDLTNPDLPGSFDPESPAYTGDLEKSESGDVVTWADGKWVVVSKSDTEATLLSLGEDDFRMNSSSSLVDDETLTTILGNAFVKNDLIELLKPITTDPMLHTPSSSEVESWTGVADYMKYHRVDSGTYPPTDQPYKWWLTDGYVDEDGNIMLGSNNGETIYYRPAITVNLTHPDDPNYEPPQPSLADRIAAIEAMIGDGDTEDTILNEIAKLKSGETIEALDWEKITNTPTTLKGYGITDAVNVDDIIIDAIVTDDLTAEMIAGKLVALGDDGKLHADITGDAHSIDGTTLDELVTEEEFAPWSLNIPVYIEKTDDFKDPRIGQMVMIPVGEPIEVDENGKPINPDAPTQPAISATPATGTVEGINTDETQNITFSDDGATMTGSTSYTYWPEYSDDPAEQYGNYVVFEVAPKTRAAAEVELVDGGKLLNDGAVFAYRLTAEKKTISFKLNGEVVAIDASGVELQGAPLTVEPLTETVWGIDPTEYQEYTVQNDGHALVGLVAYVSNWPEFSSDPEDQQGTFVWLKLTARDAGTTIKVKSKNGDAEGYKTLDDDGILIFRLSKQGQPIELLVGNEEFIIDTTKLYLEPDDGLGKLDGTITPVNEVILGKDFSTLQNLTVKENNLYINGTAAYVTDWTDFSSIPEDQNGNFIAIKIEPTKADAVVKVRSKNGDAEGYKTLDDDHILVWRLTAGENIHITIDGVYYMINVEGITLEPQA
ncbi:MAG: hypothetical protein K2F99_05015, partial [Muribaculaceae bacterium]|nr:hypothetical protein [Muribaculaceae bacterium]